MIIDPIEILGYYEFNEGGNMVISPRSTKKNLLLPKIIKKTSHKQESSSSLTAPTLSNYRKLKINSLK